MQSTKQKNSSLETNESSSADSCEEVQSAPVAPPASNFDFNLFLDTEVIPEVSWYRMLRGQTV